MFWAVLGYAEMSEVVLELCRALDAAKAVGGLWFSPGVSPAPGLAADASSRWFADVFCFGGSSGTTEVYASGLCSTLLISLVSVCSWVSLEGWG